MRPRYAEVHLFRWDDDIVWAYDAIADGIDWANQAGNIVWGNDDNIVWGNGDNIVWGNDDNIVWGNHADDNIVWGNDESDNIVWGIDDNIVWGNDDNIVWGNSADDNIVWGNGHLRDVWASNVVPGFWDDNIEWGNITRDTMDNIVWGQLWCEWGFVGWEWEYVHSQLAMNVADFDFDLPDELIAQEPPAARGGSRLMAIDRASGRVAHLTSPICRRCFGPAICWSSTTRVSFRRG